MKWTKILLLLFLLSCKKEYVCECSKTYYNAPSGDIPSDDVYLFRGSRSSAEASCTELEEVGFDKNGKFVRSCEIRQ